MKRRDLVRKFEGANCVLIRHGKKHDLYLNVLNGKKQSVPRHSEIHEKLAIHILKELGINI